MRAPPVAAALGLGAGACLLYLATLSRQPAADSLLFALAVESGDPRHLIRLRHPLLHPLGWAFVETWRALGWDGRALLPLQTFNAVGGGALVALLYTIAWRLTRSSSAAALAAGGFAVSGATWLLSTDAEFVTVPLAINLAVLAVILNADRRAWERPAFLVGIGVAIAVATLAYLSNASLAAVAVGAARLDTDGSRRSWPRRIVSLAAGASLVLVPALVALTWLRGAESAGVKLLGAYGSDGYGYFTPALSDLPHGAYTLARSLLLYPGLGMNDSTAAFLAAASWLQRAGFAAYYAVAAALAAAVPLWAWRRRAVLSRAYGRPLRLLLLWALLHGAFALVWVVGDCSFWLPVLAAWWIVVALLLASAPMSGRALAVAGIVVCTLLVANAALFILPNHDLSRSPRRLLTTAVAEQTGADDIVITPADNILRLHLRYFTGRNVIGANKGNASDTIAAALNQRRARVFITGLPHPQNAEKVADNLFLIPPP